MKIAFYTPTLFPAIEGTAIASYNLSYTLSDIRNEIHIFTNNIDPGDHVKGKYPEKEKVKNINITRFYPGTHEFSEVPVPQYVLDDCQLKIAEEEIKNSDVFHCHGFYQFQLLENFVNIALKSGIPIIYTPHGIHEIYNFYRDKKNDYLKMGKTILKKVDKIIALTKFDLPIFDELGVSGNKVEIIPNGVDVSKYDCLFEEKDKKSILNVGRIVDYKGQHIALNAVKQAMKKYPDISLTITGKIFDSNYYSKLTELCKEYDLGEQARIIPDISDFDLIGLYKKSSIFVLSSFRESFGIVNLEAMSAFMPVIATRNGGVEDVVIDKETGFIVEPGDFEKISKHIVFLIENDRERERMASNARKHAEIYDWKRIAQKTMDLYNSV